MLVLVAAAPSLALLVYFYLRDRYDREPVGCLLVAYLLGMYAMLAAQSMGAVLADAVSEEWLHLGGEPARLFEAFVLSGLVEEVGKWVMLMAAVYHWRAFDEPLDGLIYGVTIALGFATLENFFYLSSHGVGIAWQRAVFAVPAHALFGGAMGYYAGRIKFSAKAGRRVRASGATKSSVWLCPCFSTAPTTSRSCMASTGSSGSPSPAFPSVSGFSCCGEFGAPKKHHLFGPRPCCPSGCNHRPEGCKMGDHAEQQQADGSGNRAVLGSFGRGVLEARRKQGCFCGGERAHF